MSDLTDALDNWERIGVKGPIYEAARRVADAPEWLQRLLEDPPPEPDEIEWCEEHDAPSVWFDGSRPAFGRAPFCLVFEPTSHDMPEQKPCEMVRRPLLRPDDAAST